MKEEVPPWDIKLDDGLQWFWWYY